MTEAAETQKNAYAQQWEALSDRERHAIRLAEFAPQFITLIEDNKTIAWIEEFCAKIPDCQFSRSEIEFALIAAMRLRANYLTSMALKLYDRKALVAAVAEYQVEHGAIALEKLKLKGDTDAVKS